MMLSSDRSSVTQPVRGGSMIEGVIGRLQIINPLYAQASQVDQDIARLVFSGLVKMGRGREFLPDLASSWDIFDQGKTYVFRLREDVRWHDGEIFDADDVAFTIRVIQNEAYAGVLKDSWQGIDVTVINPATVQLQLPSPATFFLAQATLGILPAHLFAHLPVSEIGNLDNNTQPIGTGPYRVASTFTAARDSLSLVANDVYYGSVPFIEKIIFYFYDSEKALLSAVQSGAVTSAGLTFSNGGSGIDLPNVNAYVYPLPQYKAIFINQLGSNQALAEKAIRQALALSTNKEKILRDVAGGNAVPVDSPILPGFWGHLPGIKKYAFDFVAARDVLHRAGWKDTDGDGFLEKGDLQFSLTLSFKNNQVDNQIAEILASDWEAIGADVVLNPVAASELVDQVIRPRNYDALIFGQNLGVDSDPYVYWHSSQTNDPGLALAVMYDKDVDNNLEMARLSSSLSRAISYYHRFQNAFAELVPAILLYQPNFTYLVDEKVKGVTEKINLGSVTDRLINVTDWYIKFKRTASSNAGTLDIISNGLVEGEIGETAEEPPIDNKSQ